MGNHQEGEKFSREGRRTEPHHRTPRLFTLAFLKDAPRYIKNAGKQVHGERTIPEAKKKKGFSPLSRGVNVLSFLLPILITII